MERQLDRGLDVADIFLCLLSGPLPIPFSEQVRALAADAIRGITLEQIGMLGDQPILGAFSSDQIRALTTLGVRGFTSAQIADLTTGQLAGFTSAQINNLTSDAISGLTTQQIQSLTLGCLVPAFDGVDRA